MATNYIGRIWEAVFPGKEEQETRRKEAFISSVMRTRAFSKLSLQDQLLSLGKLITVFRTDHGFTPKSLQRSLEILNAKLMRETHRVWRASYSEPVQNGKL